MNVLMCDAHRLYAESMAAALARRGHEVLLALTPEVALTGVDRHEPDLCVVDICPPGADGAALVRALSRRERRRPVVVLTGSTDPRVHSAGLAAGAAAVVGKDQPLAVVLDVVDRIASGEEVATVAPALRADDPPEGWRVPLQADPVAGVATADEVSQVVRAHRVDVAVLAVDGAHDEFLAGAADLVVADRGPKLVAVVEPGTDPTVAVRAVRAGFRGWVGKDAGVVDLLDTVRGVVRGETRIPPLLLTGLLDGLLVEQRRHREAEEVLASLTARELEVLRAMMRGAGRDEVAVDLSISPHTARTHMQRVLRKLGVHSSVAAVAMARRAGMIDA